MPTVETYGFCKAVQNHMHPIRVSKELISAVRKGKRKNDAVLMAIIEVDHTWKGWKKESDNICKKLLE